MKNINKMRCGWFIAIMIFTSLVARSGLAECLVTISPPSGTTVIVDNKTGKKTIQIAFCKGAEASIKLTATPGDDPSPNAECGPPTKMYQWTGIEPDPGDDPSPTIIFPTTVCGTKSYDFSVTLTYTNCIGVVLCKPSDSVTVEVTVVEVTAKIGGCAHPNNGKAELNVEGVACPTGGSITATITIEMSPQPPESCSPSKIILFKNGTYKSLFCKFESSTGSLIGANAEATVNYTVSGITCSATYSLANLTSCADAQH